MYLVLFGECISKKNVKKKKKKRQKGNKQIPKINPLKFEFLFDT